MKRKLCKEFFVDKLFWLLHYHDPASHDAWMDAVSEVVLGCLLVSYHIPLVQMVSSKMSQLAQTSDSLDN